MCLKQIPQKQNHCQKASRNKLWRSNLCLIWNIQFFLKWLFLKSGRQPMDIFECGKSHSLSVIRCISIAWDCIVFVSSAHCKFSLAFRKPYLVGFSGIWMRLSHPESWERSPELRLNLPQKSWYEVCKHDGFLGSKSNKRDSSAGLLQIIYSPLVYWRQVVRPWKNGFKDPLLRLHYSPSFHAQIYFPLPLLRY